MTFSKLAHQVRKKKDVESEDVYRSRQAIVYSNAEINFAARNSDADSIELLKNKRKRRSKKIDHFLVLASIFTGILGVVIIFTLAILQWSSRNHTYCLALDEDFNGPLNTTLWNHDVQVGGFGNMEFEWTTSSVNNSYTKDGKLYITPTLTSDLIGVNAVENGYTVNLTESGQCTADKIVWEDGSRSTDLRALSIGNTDVNCQITSNSTIGTIIPPIQSARLTTNGTFSLKYGRVEIRAKMPTGDWIWPAVWMMPKSSVYGPWPQSGEIDIFEGKGNLASSRDQQLSNTMRSALHWGVSPSEDQYSRSSALVTLWRNLWNDDFHTFGLEWDEKGIWTWRDSRAHKVLQVDFDKPFITKAPSTQGFQGWYAPPPNPWSISNATGAPFDQEFFLILNVAVGGTNGYFADVGQPWSNADPRAARTFWNQRSSWLSTWGPPEERSMIIDYVKAWKRC